MPCELAEAALRTTAAEEGVGSTGGEEPRPVEGADLVTDGKPAYGSRRRRVRQSRVLQGRDDSRRSRKARGRAAQEGTGEGGARRITVGSPARVRVGGLWMGARCIVMRAVDGEVGKNRRPEKKPNGKGRVRRVGSGMEGLIPYPGHPIDLIYIYDCFIGIRILLFICYQKSKKPN